MPQPEDIPGTPRFLVHHDDGSVPIKHWTRGVMLEESALEQLRNVARLPFIHKHVAVMADVHAGMGATIGSVIATKGAIIPAAVGVDIGCGMSATRTTLTASQLPDNLFGIRSSIQAAVPHGRTQNGAAGDCGAWADVPEPVLDAWAEMSDRFEDLCDKHPTLRRSNNVIHLGTLGTGNHFIELCLDEDDRVWVMLHSGSRGVGNRIGTYFIQLAKKDMQRWFIDLPDRDLSYLTEGTEHFVDYREAVGWAQDYAHANRMLMMSATLAAISRSGDVPAFEITDEAVDCHHNYVARENHFRENVWVTRKGAVRARLGDMGIIPGSMGSKSFIVRGKGSQHSFHSCSHGAGRVMSRTKAKKWFTVEDLERSTAGVECRKDADVLDEHPDAYKSIDAVMAAQSDLVEVVHTLRQVVCVKG